MQELLGHRQWNAKSFLPEDGKGTATEFHVKWIHYMKEDGSWGDIDCIIKETDSGFEVTDAPFLFRAPFFADEETYFESNCRFDVFTKRRIDDAPLGRYMRCTTTRHVRGELYDLNNNGRMDSVIYRDAFPGFEADLIYFVEHGRAPRLRQLVVFHHQPPGAGQVRIPFAVRFTGDVDIKWFDAKSEEKLKRSNERMEKAQRLREGGSRKEFIESLVEELKAKEDRTEKWEKRGKLKTKNGIWHRHSGTKTMRGIGLKPFSIWDSGKGDAQNRQDIDVEYERDGEGFTFTKILPRAFFRDALFPVYTDDTSTFYPDPNTEVTSVDGEARRSPGLVSFSDLRTGSGTSISDSAASEHMACLTASTGGQTDLYQFLSRGIFGFDTSALNDSATIQSAILSLYGETVGSNFTPSHSVVVDRNVPFTATSLTASDYALARWNGIEQSSTRITINPSFSTGAYNAFTLNSTGKSNVSKTGVSWFGFRLNCDFDNTTPTWGNGLSSHSGVFYSDEAGTTKDPKLVVVHSVPPSSLSATPVTATSNMTLTWTDNSADEDEFSLERSNDGSTGWAVVGTFGPNVTSGTDAVGSFDALRYYRIRDLTVSDGLYSDYSNTASGTTSPAAPGSFAASASGVLVTLTWTNVSTTFSEVRIERSSDGGTSYAEIGVTTGATFSETVEGDITYIYRARSYRSSDGMYSPYTSTVSLSAATINSVSAGCIDQTSGASKIEVLWESFSLLAEAFKIERSLNDSTWTQVAIVSPWINRYVDTGLATDTLYYYRVSTMIDGSVTSTSASTSARTLTGRASDLRNAFLKKTRNFPSTS